MSPASAGLIFCRRPAIGVPTAVRPAPPGVPAPCRSRVRRGDRSTSSFLGNQSDAAEQGPEHDVAVGVELDRGLVRLLSSTQWNAGLPVFPSRPSNDHFPSPTPIAYTRFDPVLTRGMAFGELTSVFTQATRNSSASGSHSNYSTPYGV